MKGRDVIMGAKGRVVAGDYAGRQIMDIFGAAELSTSFFNHFVLDKSSVESYELLEKEAAVNDTSMTFVDTDGNVHTGIMSGTSGSYTLVLNFKDGKRSLAEVNEEMYKILQRTLFELTGSSQVKQPACETDELLRWKGLLDQGVITAEEFEGKKKQLLGL